MRTYNVEFHSTSYRYVIPVCILIFLCFSIVRSPVIFISPRFWAEEGTLYFQSLEHLSWHEAIVYRANNNFQLLTNILVSLASAAPSSLAPTVTTYGSILAAAPLPYAIARAARDNGLDPISTILASALVASVPMAFEIFGTATNIQWYAAAILFFTIFWRFESATLSLGLLAFALIYGWSGVPSAMLFPAFLVMGIVQKSRAHILISAVLFTAIIIQVASILGGSAIPRHFEHRPSLLIFPTVLHSILGLWMSPTLTSALGGQEFTVADKLSLAAVSALILSLPLKLASNSRVLALFALFVGFCASITQTFAGIGNAADFLKPITGGRYYFISTCAIIFALMIASKYSPLFIRVALIGSMLVNISVWYSRDWAVFTVGKPWNESLNACKQITCVVPIWPAGWTVEIDK